MPNQIKLFALLLLLGGTLFCLSCEGLHDDLYGDQSVTFKNTTSYSLSVDIRPPTGDWRGFGSVGANETKTLAIDLGSDCHYDFRIDGGGHEWTKYDVNCCGGATLTINP